MTSHRPTAPGTNGVATEGLTSATQAVAIVIPVYRSAPNALEAIALAQCCKLLGQYPIILVCTDTFEIRPYLQLCGEHGIEPLVECFDQQCLSSVKAYNQLLFDRHFYQRFAKYTYILIHQLDAFVFKDTLTYWCHQGYDYLGAPWFEGSDESTAADPLLPWGGNGGLSLRRVGAFMAVLTPPFPRARVRTWDDLWRKYRGLSLVGKAWRFHRLLHKYLRKSNLYGNYLATPKMFEDGFFSMVVPRVFPGFKVAPAAVGMFFAFECQPRRLFVLTARELPFGCHAWERYDPGFWQPFIEAFGHVMPPARTPDLESRA
ncbi:MAG: DUF5672 family protein [Verrucomicrobia bacterium]|nr:DUF5672 family protein [Verrucomicrobiota bacterium]